MVRQTFSFYIANPMMKKLITGLFFLGFSTLIQAQLRVESLNVNPTIKNYLQQAPDYSWNQSSKLHKANTYDTIQLPFFEEFLGEHIYPDSSKWLDNFVFVNRSFGVRPPSYGVATFDQLGPDGNPYQPLHNTDVISADTLTSQFIDLTELKGYSLTASDSIYLSFYFQPKGRGQQILSTDELKLSFKKANGDWTEVWSQTGREQSEFEQVLILIDSAYYLHEGFQFRFNNISHRWGNNNHWHIDYIELDTGRRAADLYNRDVAIQRGPASMLKNYSVLPYSHYLVDAANESHNTTQIRLSNRSNLLKQISVKYRETVDAIVVGSIDNFTNIDNCNPYNDTLRTIDLYDFSGLSGNIFTIDRKYICKEDSQESIRRYQFNDTIISHQVFDNYYARDDGTAEAGFGFDNLIGRDGSIAVRFDMKKRDTLQGVGFYFTQINHDVSEKRFTIKVWRSIDINGGKDSLVYEEFRSKPTYSNKINGYTFYPISTDIVLDAGTYYVGWTQDSDFSLNVGLDQNHGLIVDREKSANPDLFYNIGGSWIANTNPNLYGSPMIRAYVGEYNDPTVNVEKVKDVALRIYPNPSSGVIHFTGLNITNANIYNMQGQLIHSSEVKNEQIDLSELRNGRYLLRWNNVLTHKAGASWVDIFHN
jgi:hypothetical protein